MSTLTGKRVLITGGNRGFGAVLADAFVSAGADVLLCARDEKALSKVKNELEARLSGNQRIHSMPADVSSPDDVKRLVDWADSSWGGLDVLVNNAGIYGPFGKLHEVPWEEWIRAMEINLYGSALMCRQVLPLFVRQKAGRIIQLSGGGATNPLPQISAYAASKAAIVRLVETLAGEYQDQNIFINAIAPGALNTRLLDEVLTAGPGKVGEAFYRKALQQKEQGGASMDRAAALAVFLASDEAAGLTGRLISAVWDPWEDFPSLKKRIMEGDIYTLRRIIPEDRGQKWT